MIRALTALGLLALAVSSPAQAQETDSELPPVTYPDIVTEAATADGFVPQGWKLEFTAQGDLNKDGKSDLALVLRGTDEKNVLINPPLGPERYDTNPRMLVVALAKESGYRLVLADRTLIPRPDNPSQDDPLSESGGVSIDRGSLVVGFYLFMSAGGSDTGNWHYRFRLEDGRFRLIGYDSYNVNRMSGAVDEVSINYLTGKVVTKTGSMETDEAKSKTTKMKKKPVLYLEDIGDGLMFEPEY